MTVASTLVHRFYMRRSFKDFPEDVSGSRLDGGLELIDSLWPERYCS
jgi:hypothetical protein